MPFTKESRAQAPPRGPSILNRTVKETVLAVFNKMQDDTDAKWNLYNWAKRKPDLFYPIAARLIPTEMTSTIRRVINVNVITNGNEQLQLDEQAQVISISGEVVDENKDILEPDEIDDELNFLE